MIGLISFHCQYSCGSALQALANSCSGLDKIYREMTDIRCYLARIGDHILYSIKPDLKKVFYR